MSLKLICLICEHEIDFEDPKKPILKNIRIVSLTLTPDENWSQFCFEKIQLLAHVTLETKQKLDAVFKFKQPGLVSLCTKVRIVDENDLSNTTFKKNLYLWSMVDNGDFETLIDRQMTFEDEKLDLNTVTKHEYVHEQ